MLETIQDKLREPYIQDCGGVEVKTHSATEMEAADYIDALEAEIQALGDASTDVFEQMLRGNWRDDYDHDVSLNKQMISLREAVFSTITRRAEQDTTDRIAYVSGQNFGETLASDT